MLEKVVKKRKKRSDRNHILYQLQNVHTGAIYIGISARIGTPKKTLQERFRRHVSKAIHEGKSWALHRALRRHSDSTDWNMSVIGQVRGRKAAHAIERILISKNKPKLNTF